MGIWIFQPAGVKAHLIQTASNPTEVHAVQYKSKLTYSYTFIEFDNLVLQ